MHRTPGQFARTPHLRVLAWLAWLILAVMPAHGSAAAMMGEAQAMDAMPSTMQMADHLAHGTMADCCAGEAPHAHDATGNCHCAATCASVLPVLAMAELAPAPVDAMPVPRHGAAAPGVIGSPPLRPPQLQASRLT